MNGLRAKGAVVGVLGAAIVIAGLTASPRDALGIGQGGSGQGGAADTNNGAVSLTLPVTRSTVRRESAKHPEWINYKDCRDNVAIAFHVAVSNYAGKTLRGYMSGSIGGIVTDCRTYQSRTNSSVCFEFPGDANGDFKIDASTILANLKIDNCGLTSGNLANVPVSFYFMLVDDASTSDITMDYATFNDLHVDLWGPAAPKMKEIGIGDGQLIVNFETTTSNDALSYNIYQDPPPSPVPASCTADAGASSSSSSSGASSSSASSGASSSSASSGAGGSDGGVMGVDGGLSDGGTGSSTSSGAGGAGSGSGGAGGNTSAGAGGDPSGGACSSTLLVAGEVPPTCLPAVAEVTAGSKAVTGLTNGQTYTFAVSATDVVDNAGPLSTPVCGVPLPVDSFWKEYCKDGGQACKPGGCGCTSVGARDTILWPALSSIGFTALGIALIRRRRRRSARRPEAR